MAVAACRERLSSRYGKHCSVSAECSVSRPSSLALNKSPELVEFDPGKGFRSCGAENSYSSATNREPSMLGSPGRLLITTLTELSRLVVAYLLTYSMEQIPS